MFTSGRPEPQQFLLVSKVLGREFLGVEVAVGFAQQIVGRCGAHDPSDGHVGRHEPALLIFDVDQVEQMVQQRAEQIALARQRLFPPLAWRNIAAYFDDARNITQRVAHRRRGDLDEHLVALGVAERMSDGQRGLGGEDLRQRAGIDRAVARSRAMMRYLMARAAVRHRVNVARQLAGHPIGQEDAVIATDDQHRVGKGVDDRLQENLGLPDGLFHVPALGDIGDRGLTQGHLHLGLGDGDAAKLHGDQPAIVGQEMQFGDDLTMLAHALPHMLEERLLVFPGYPGGEGIPDEILASDVQQLSPRQVDLLHVAVFIESNIAQRCEVVEVYVAVAIGLHPPLSVQQSLVLRLQLFTPQFEFVYEALHLFGRRFFQVVNVRTKQAIDPPIERGMPLRAGLICTDHERIPFSRTAD